MNNINKPSGILVLAKQVYKQEVALCSAIHQNGQSDETSTTSKKNQSGSSDRVEFSKKLRMKTPLGKLDEHSVHPHQEKEPLKPWPNNTNPHTGEIGGPAGPEPTRYGDWERKGRVTDF